MAYNTIFFENPRTGQKREAPVGFSWTILFFGPIPMLFRSNWKWFAIIFIVGAITWGLSNIVFAFIANGFHTKDLVAEGFKAKRVMHGELNQFSQLLGTAYPELRTGGDISNDPATETRASSSSFDDEFEERWRNLVKFDDRIQLAIKQLQPYGFGAIAELKQAFHTINDFERLPKFVEIIVQEKQAEQVQRDEQAKRAIEEQLALQAAQQKRAEQILEAKHAEQILEAKRAEQILEAKRAEQEVEEAERLVAELVAEEIRAAEPKTKAVA